MTDIVAGQLGGQQGDPPEGHQGQPGGQDDLDMARRREQGKLRNTRDSVAHHRVLARQVY